MAHVTCESCNKTRSESANQLLGERSNSQRNAAFIDSLFFGVTADQNHRVYPIFASEFVILCVVPTYISCMCRWWWRRWCVGQQYDGTRRRVIIATCDNAVYSMPCAGIAIPAMPQQVYYWPNMCGKLCVSAHWKLPIVISGYDTHSIIQWDTQQYIYITIECIPAKSTALTALYVFCLCIFVFRVCVL